MSHPSPSNPIGNPFVELPSVDSTNNYALARIHAGLAQHGTAFFSHEQVQGKGQRGKSWSSGKDTSIILSLVINPGLLPLSRQFQLSACAAVSVHEFFSGYAGDQTAIKWPNDLYWQDRKAGGILIENSIANGGSNPSGWQWAVAGIGININQPQFLPELQNAVSLRQITGKEWNPLELAKQLCSVFEKNFRLLTADGFQQIYQRYNDHLFRKNKKVKLRKESRVFEATILEVSENGTLVTYSGTKEEFNHGEIEWLLA